MLLMTLFVPAAEGWSEYLHSRLCDGSVPWSMGLSVGLCSPYKRPACGRGVHGGAPASFCEGQMADATPGKTARVTRKSRAKAAQWWRSSQATSIMLHCLPGGPLSGSPPSPEQAG